MVKKWLNFQQLSEKLGDVSKSKIYRLLHDDPNFPRPVRLGRGRYWDEGAVDAYMDALLKAQTQTAA